MNVIRDKSLEPYHIRLDDYNYTVCTETVIKSGKDKGEVRPVYHTYHSKLSSAVMRICKLKSVHLDGEVDLAEYVMRFEKAKQEILDRIGI